MRARLPAFLLAAAVVVLDRLTKLWIQAEVSLFDQHAVIPGFFNIIHTENRGMAFGLFHNSESPWRRVVLVGAASLILIVVGRMLWRIPSPAPAGQRILRVALSLVLGGAVGNLYDRIVRGSVTDFLEFYLGSYSWPAFNIADTAITIGACLLVLDLLLGQRGHKT